ncbi:MAG: hypothetical protein R2776_04285 [Flavobacteriaceae bacterium]
MKAQVGIGTTNPDTSTILDITATDKGVLVPRVNLTDVTNNTTPVTTPATGLLVWNTNAAVTGGNGTGFYFFNGTQWMPIQQTVSGDHDFYEEGTTTSPDDINDDQYTMGNLAIGKTTADYPLDILSNTSFYGSSVSLGGTDDFGRVGYYSNISNSGNITRQYGFWASLGGSGSSEHGGVYNSLGGVGNGLQIGVYNAISNRGTGHHYGVENFLSGTGTGQQIGVRTVITNQSNNPHYGNYSLLSGTGNGNKYGTYNRINNSSGGTHYGVYSEVLKSGSYAGYFLGNVSIGTTTTNNYLLPTSRGTANQLMQTDGSGNVSWVDATTVGDDDHDFYEEGTSTPPDDINDDQYTMGNLAIGKTTADFPLDIQNSNGGRGVSILLDGTTNTTHYGEFIRLEGSGTGTHNGTEIQMSGSGSGAQLGTINFIDNSGDGLHYGSYNILSGTGIGTHYGNWARLQGAGTGQQYGTYINIANSGNATHYGEFIRLEGNGTGTHNGTEIQLGGSGSGNQLGTINVVSNSGNGLHYGSYNVLNGIGSGTHYGNWTRLEGTGTGLQVGNSIELTNSGDGNHTGTYALLNGNGTGTHKGVDTVISGSGDGSQIGAINAIANSGNGIHYGSINSVNGSGNGIHYGMYNGLFGNGTGVQYANYNLINNAGNNVHYGIFNDLTGVGSGNKYGTYNLISSTAGGTHYGVYSEALKSGSYAGYFLGNVSIGTTTANNYILPASRGTNGQVMQTNGTGTVSWVDDPSPSYWTRSGGVLNFATATDDITFTSDQTSITFPATTATAAPMFYMFASGFNNPNRMIFSHSIGASTYGLLYDDVDDSFQFLRAGVNVVEIDIFGTNEVLTVNGNLRVNGDVVTDTATYPDYVFEKYYEGTSALKSDYTFMNLEDLEQFIAKEKHLPNVKSYQEVEQAGMTISVGEMTVTNLEKIEEAFLYIIELKKENDLLKRKLEKQEQEIQEIKNLLNK